MARCDLTDLDTTACAHCLGHTDPETDTRRERAQLLATGRWTAAQFPGTCQHCGERFTPGTPIRMEIPAGWRAACCADPGR
ncbi:hypothetical protein [Streptomyces subrutilus]|uniref:hypothetical protein n=1 Tax=Streptomyces subrutilus TaxID=36818 RepID=UPI002E0E3415|nr:hypothetical protein OG479_32780 [Streptomyces subrutilus]